MKSKLISSFMKPICSAVHFFQSKGAMREVIRNTHINGLDPERQQGMLLAHHGWKIKRKRKLWQCNSLGRRVICLWVTKREGESFSKGTVIKSDPSHKNGQNFVSTVRW